jgi:hypothetical protein
MSEIQYHTDPVTGALVVATREDIEPILAAAHEGRKEHGARARYGGDGGTQHLVAHLPCSVVLWLREQGISRDQKKFRKWLNGPGAIYKTRGGTV